MDKFIGIIVAMEEELLPIEEIMKIVETKTIYNLKFYEGSISDKKYVLVKSNIGKVNGARATQVMIDQYPLDYIINIGSAGGLHDDLNIYDFVIGKDMVQHDFNLTAFGYEKGYISDIGTKLHSSDELIGKYSEAIRKLEKDKSKIKIGTIATGDKFFADAESKEILKGEFNADCVEMEAAAIGQVCALCDIPFIAIKSISDKLNGENHIQFKEYLKKVSKRCAELINIAELDKKI